MVPKDVSWGVMLGLYNWEQMDGVGLSGCIQNDSNSGEEQ
jgi:hypothetical protein